MLVKNAGIRGKCNLVNRWEEDPYKVIDQPNDEISLNKVKRESAGPKTRLLSWNFHAKCKKISNDQELIQSDPTSCPQNQKGNN